MCKYLCEILLSVLLNTYPEVGLLDMVILVLIFWRTAILFFIAAVPFYSPINTVHKHSSFSTSVSTHTYFTVTILMKMKQCLIVAFICISLISDVEHIFICILRICILSLGKGVFKSFVHLKIRVFISQPCSF